MSKTIRHLQPPYQAKNRQQLLEESSLGEVDHKPSCGEMTACIHEGADTLKSYGPLTLPIVTSTTFHFKSLDELHRFHSGELPYEYGRYGSPTVNGCEQRMAALDHAEDSVLFASGMNAVTTALLTFLDKDSHLIIGSDSYRRTRQFCEVFLKRFGVSTSVVEMGDYDALEQAIRPNTRVILFESPTNPYLRVVDLNRLRDMAQKHKIVTMIDSTFATPYVQRPLDFGIDLVIHSATKYLGGHNDLICGVVSGTGEVIARVREARGVYGGIADAHAASTLERSLKTLVLRMRQHNESAAKIAERLADHPAIEQVWYPGLSSHPDHAVAAEQMNGFGGVVTFTIAGSLLSTCRFIDRLTIPKIADSLGGAESLIKHVALMSFYKFTREERLSYGITDNLVRLSVGLEDCDDLIADLDQALEVVPLLKKALG
jgi:cystathionine gamma-synthase